MLNPSYIILRIQRLEGKQCKSYELAHYDPPHQDLRSLQIQLFSSLVVKELKKNLKIAKLCINVKLRTVISYWYFAELHCTAEATHISFGQNWQCFCVQCVSKINVLLSNDRVSLEQPGPESLCICDSLITSIIHRKQICQVQYETV